VAAALLLTQRGTPFLYYGEEIGMRDVKLNRSQILDPVGKHYWPFYKGRDGCRAPMQWDASPNAGFSKGQPWLPLHPDYRERNVEAQLADKTSLLNFYKQVLAIRRKHPELVSGNYQSLTGMPSGVMAYQRKLGDAAALILLNFNNATQKISLQGRVKNWQIGLSSKGRREIDFDQPVQLQGNEALILFSN
jgi:alpha-glucosidase